MRALALLLALAVGGCAASGTTSIDRKPRPEEIDHTKTVSLRIDAPADEDSQKVRRELVTKLWGALASQSVFRQIVQPGEAADYRLEIKLSDIALVSEMGRFYGSIFAGPSKLTAAIDLRQSGAATPILAASVTAKSALDEHYGQSTIHDAIDKAVDQIVTALQP